MSNAELQAELAKYPGHLRVKVLMTGLEINNYDGRPIWVELSPGQSIESDRVIFEGGHLLVESK